jgi:alanyl-tRNA synthetase
MYDQVADARRRRRPLPTRRFQDVLAKLQTRVADVTETVERAENALKVTDDVYLARVYGAALELFRATAWRRGIERKLEIFRSTYAMLNGEAQSARSELLEIAVIVIIVAEVVLGFFH